MDATTTLKRLRWRCRRGTRELDALLGGWLDAEGAQTDETTLTAFDEMLEEPDPLIWDWLKGHTRPTRADWLGIIGAIRACNRI